jgi:hypothetical protein
MSEKVLIVSALTLAMAAFASASGWDIAASYPAPAPNARGVALFAPFYISVLCDGTPPRIYNLTEPSKYIDLAIPKGAWGVSNWFGDGITVSNYSNSYIYALTTLGSVISSFRSPKDHPADLSGPYFDEYVAIPAENLALQITTKGSVISSFHGPGTRLTAVEARYPYGGIVGDPATHRVYFLSDFGTAVLTSPVGTCASVKTGEPPYDDVWVVDAATNYVYLFNWHGSKAVAPASFGRVKALYW